jgi:hypothetical protein
MRKALEIGGFVAGAVLVVFGVAAIVLAVNGNNTINSNLTAQKIVGTPDMTPAAIQAEAAKAGLKPGQYVLPSCSVAGLTVDTGSRARCFAQYMQIHALEASGGLTYAQMPRYATANGQGTNDATKALTVKGQPVDNPARNVWVNETALSTALNVAYMGSQLSLFSVVVGVALVLSGIGFGILAFAALHRSKAAAAVTVPDAPPVMAPKEPALV